MGQGPSLEDHLFQLRFTAKQLNRIATKSEKDIAAEKLKLKKAIEQGNVEGQRLYAQNAIRKKNERMNYLRLASRIEAVASRLQSAVKMNQVTATMGQIVKAMDGALKEMDMNKIAKVMDTFERQFEDLDVQASYVEHAMDMSTATTTPEEEVDGLISQVADEYGLEVSTKLESAGRVPTKAPATAEHDDLAARLERIKNP